MNPPASINLVIMMICTENERDELKNEDFRIFTLVPHDALF